jgi:hypothetical protein
MKVPVLDGTLAEYRSLLELLEKQAESGAESEAVS